MNSAIVNEEPANHALRVVVTGGATNIGRAITETFLKQNARVVVGQPDPAIAEPLVRRYGSRVVPLRVDVADPVQCREFIDAAAAALGGLDILVNNAAITGSPALSSLSTLTPLHFEEITRVNLGGPVFCSQAAVPYLRSAGGGVIIHISSVNAFRPQQDAMIYAATKAAVSSLAQSMAKELAPEGIRVVAVAPGDIQVETTPAPVSPGAVSDLGRDGLNQTPLGRGQPQDIAETVVFLCSPRAKFVTGVTWVVDGGLLA